MNTNITVGDLAMFVLKNQRRDGFKEWTLEQLVHKLALGIDNHSTFYSLNKNNEIDGVVVGTKDATRRVMFVDGILTTSPGVFRRFVQLFYKLYPNWQLEANRKGKPVIYNTVKFINKFIH